MTVILSSLFTGSPSNIDQYFQDVMTFVRKYAKCDLFITYTVKPRHPRQSTATWNTWKLARHVKDIRLPVIHVYVTEFQKRGLLHCHMLVVLRNDDKLIYTDGIYRVVTADIRDANDDSVLHDLVKNVWYIVLPKQIILLPLARKMTHVKNRFTKNYGDEWLRNLNDYPEYIRGNTSVTV